MLKEKHLIRDALFINFQNLFIKDKIDLMDKKYLKQFIENTLHLDVNDEVLSKFEKYEALLKEWNAKFNLTAIRDDQGILEKHFIDSIYPMVFVDFKDKKLCDIGSGAGFPGIPLAILNPSLTVVLVEASGKKTTFLNEVKNVLGLENLHVLRMRVEVLKYREHFDFVSARAVTQMNILSELAIPLLKINGELLAYKLYDVENELNEAKNAFKVLDASLEDVKKYNLPISGDGRSLVIIKKNGKTKLRYPRPYSEISAKPL